MEWKRVPGFDGTYEATACGRVRRRHASGVYREITPATTDRYGFVRLNARCNKKGKIKKARLAQMVALAWVPKPTPGHRFVYPINGSPADIRAENLAWKRNPTGDGKGSRRGVPGSRSGTTMKDMLAVLTALRAGPMPYSELAVASGVAKKPLMRLCPFMREKGYLTHTGNHWEVLEAGVDAIPQLYECERERALLKMLKLSTREARSEARRRVTLRDRYEVLSRGSCACCGRTVAEHGVVLHVDHIVPVAAGGGNDLANLQALCWHCNMGKSDRLDAPLVA